MAGDDGYQKTIQSWKSQFFIWLQVW